MQWRLFWGMMAYGALVGLLIPIVAAVQGMSASLSFWIGFLLIGLLLVGFVNYLIVKLVLRNFLVRFLNQFNPLIERPLPKPGSPFKSTELDHLDELFSTLIGQLKQYIDATVQRETVLQRLQRYFPPALARSLAADADSLDQPHVMNVTVMFADIRSFTHMSSKLEGPRVVEILNDYFTAMIDPIQERGGTVLKLIGDEVMAVYGAPVSLNDDAERAVASAIAMHDGFRRLKEGWLARGLDVAEIGLGIGLNRGQVVVGNIGSPRHLDYTIIGDAVNVASRLQHVARHGETIVSASVAEAVDPQRPALEEREPVMVKGKDEPQRIYCLS